MRFIFTLLSLLLLVSSLDAQKLTGIWRGYFTSSPMSSGLNLQEERYKYEIQIEQLANNSISGVTYSYKTTVFYGKAELKGILTLPAKSLIVKETRLIDLRISDKSEPCLMTCYLDYTKMGKLEVLEGTFISVNIKDKRDCGSGKIYLEKVTTTEFEKEPFLVKKGDSTKRNDSTPRTSTTRQIPGNSTKNRADNLAVKPAPVSPKPQQKTTTSTQKKSSTTTNTTTTKSGTQTKPPVTNKPATKNTTAATKNNTAKKDDKPSSSTATVSSSERNTDRSTAAKEETVDMPREVAPPPKQMSLPKVLIERENNLIRTINTSEEDVLIELYDNGTIDHDTISVYHNNELVISNRCLTYSPIQVKIKCNTNTPVHELVIVAENLGEIPPNSALMVVKAGRERYEVTLASTERRNAKVVVRFAPKN
jgi:hypothetical protein